MLLPTILEDVVCDFHAVYMRIVTCSFAWLDAAIEAQLRKRAKTVTRPPSPDMICPVYPAVCTLARQARILEAEMTVACLPSACQLAGPMPKAADVCSAARPICCVVLQCKNTLNVGASMPLLNFILNSIFTGNRSLLGTPSRLNFVQVCAKAPRC